MMEGFMGAENTRQGYIKYLSTFATKTATTNQLWDMMQPFAAGINITEVMQTWTGQRGFPLVNVDWIDNKLILTQTRFLANINATYNKSDTPFQYNWIIPVTYVCSGDYRTVKPLWMGLDDSSLTIDLPYNVEWVKVNILEYAFFRVNYSLRAWKSLAFLLIHNMTALDSVDRANLLEDAFTLAESKYISYDIPLELTMYLDQETAYLPWYTMLNRHIGGIASIVKPTRGYPLYRKYFANKLRPHADTTLWNFTPQVNPVKRLTQSLLLDSACEFGIESCLKVAKRLTENWLLRCGAKPSRDIFITVLRFGIYVSGQKIWNALWNKYQNETDSDARGIFRVALCYAQEPGIISYLFKVAQTEDLVRLIEDCVDTPVGLSAVWTYVQEKWQYLANTFPNDFASILETVTASFSTDILLKEVEAFLEKIPDKVVGAAERQNILDSIKWRIDTVEKYSPALIEWFENAVK